MIDLDDDDLLFNYSDQDIKDSFPKQPSAKLADIIVSYRYIGLYKDLSILAMEELSKRRSLGDTFQFEQYIDDNIKTLPKLDFQLPNLANILKTFGSFKK